MSAPSETVQPTPAAAGFIAAGHAANADMSKAPERRTLSVLVDYDNVHEIHRSKGLEYLARRIAAAIDNKVLTSVQRFRLRLYGGWFEQVRPTRRAQDLAAEIAGFPISVAAGGGEGGKAVIVSAELATGLIVEPRLVLTHTVRRRTGPAGLRCEVPSGLCGVNPSCPLGSVARVLAGTSCTVEGCAAVPAERLWKLEQKMVDTLLASDLVYLAIEEGLPVVVVSNDDDIWPAIRLALTGGAPVMHIHPIPGRSTPTHYIVALPAGYQQATLN